MPRIYSDVPFSSLLSLIILPEKNWSHCHKINRPFRNPRSSQISWACLIHTVSTAKLLLSSGLDLVIWASHHLLINTDLTTFTWSSVFHNSDDPKTNWGIQYRQILSCLHPTTTLLELLYLLITHEIFSSSQMPSWWQQFIKPIQSSLNPSLE